MFCVTLERKKKSSQDRNRTRVYAVLIYTYWQRPANINTGGDLHMNVMSLTVYLQLINYLQTFFAFASDMDCFILPTQPAGDIFCWYWSDSIFPLSVQKQFYVWASRGGLWKTELNTDNILLTHAQFTCRRINIKTNKHTYYECSVCTSVMYYSKYVAKCWIHLLTFRGKQLTLAQR